MEPQNINSHSDPNYNEYSYENQEFDLPSYETYAYKVDRIFTINYQSSTYQNIQLSTNQMRLMMKDLSKKLDDKIHKYYGLMAQKHSKYQEDLQSYKQKLQKQLQTHKKLIQAQITEIKDIQQLDIEMGSIKRVQKQAQRLRQYFDTKKAMIQADKQARFSKGQMDKAGQYLARDLDSEKYYFRLNKIKEQFEYAMLKQRNLIKQIDNLDQKYKQLQQKNQQINEAYNQKVIQAENNKLLIEDNKKYFNDYQTKKHYLLMKDEIKKKTQIMKYNVQNTVIKLVSDVEKMKRIQKEQIEKIAFYENQIQKLSKEVNQSYVNHQITSKIELNASIRNINVLLKTKRQRNDEMVKNSSQIFEKSTPEFKPINEMSESSILLKPNFKIKQYLTKSKVKMDPILSSRVNKSMDFDRNEQKKKYLKDSLDNNSPKDQNDKRILKWEPRKRQSASKKLIGMLGDQLLKNKSNPEN